MATVDLTKAAGLVLYEGPSLLDGAPIVVIATGLKARSTNRKTGAMVQTYILRSDVKPIDAVKLGLDASVCGDCVHRGDGTGKGRSCYVNLGHGPRSVFDAYQRGVYPYATPWEAAEILAGRMVRLGAYGDPLAAPYALWNKWVSKAAGWTGYTHQWRGARADWQRLVMASADSEPEAREAWSLGWRTFRVTPDAGENIKGLEIICPASDEAGKKTDCASCKACMGTGGKARASVQIAAHGAGGGNVRKRAA